MCQASWIAASHAAGRSGDMRIGSSSPGRVRACCPVLVFPIPIMPTDCPCGVMSSAHRRRPSRKPLPQRMAPFGSLSSSLRTSMAPIMCAILSASAMATGIACLRAGRPANHALGRLPSRLLQRTTAMAPMIGRRRISRCPILDVRPSLCWPLFECRAAPGQAGPRSLCLARRVRRGGAKVSMATAQIGPAPGMVRRRRTTSLRRALTAIRRSILPMSSVILAICVRWTRFMSRIRSGR